MVYVDSKRGGRGGNGFGEMRKKEILISPTSYLQLQSYGSKGLEHF